MDLPEKMGASDSKIAIGRLYDDEVEKEVYARV